MKTSGFAGWRGGKPLVRRGGGLAVCLRGLFLGCAFWSRPGWERGRQCFGNLLNTRMLGAILAVSKHSVVFTEVWLFPGTLKITNNEQ